MSSERARRQMDRCEWVWLIVFNAYTAIYRAHGIWALLLALLLSAVLEEVIAPLGEHPLVRGIVPIWGLIAMHRVYGCKVSLVVCATWATFVLIIVGIAWMI